MSFDLGPVGSSATDDRPPYVAMIPCSRPVGARRSSEEHVAAAAARRGRAPRALQAAPPFTDLTAMLVCQAPGVFLRDWRGTIPSTPPGPSHPRFRTAMTQGSARFATW